MGNDGPRRILTTHPSNRAKEGHICRLKTTEFTPLELFTFNHVKLSETNTRCGERNLKKETGGSPTEGEQGGKKVSLSARHPVVTLQRGCDRNLN
ncbi:hypothetical protein ATANTOWER_018543 [Ataeniobius toweri]|uniref:Uncharacterized protein n=1 Tax=Ataeniobius toweri TaxID=208326 RepID=A0ABU7CAK6_9TELE|nr:hypothetical protein [Ataeniobius toweri]